MKIRIKYFASMRENVGKSEETWETNASTAEELLSQVCKEYSLNDSQHLKIAINEEYVNFSQTLKEMDTVAFIPPVGGG